MAEYPILLKGWGVRATLEGRKTQTRRIPSTTNSLLNGWRVGGRGVGREIWNGLDWSRATREEVEPFFALPCPDGMVHDVAPLYQPGDTLWVRETWAQIFTAEGCVHGDDFEINARDEVCPCPGCHVEYRADSGDKYPAQWPDDAGQDAECPKWRASIHMPRWASRITLEVVSVRAERLQEIRGTDCVAEGVGWVAGGGHATKRRRMVEEIEQGYPGHRRLFAQHWDAINAKRGYGWDANPPVWVIEYRMVEEDCNA